MTKKDVVFGWLEKARKDLEFAKFGLSARNEDYADEICVLAQQAAEKQLKALLSHYGFKVEKSHDLVGLLLLFPETTRAKFNEEELGTLGTYAVTPRYPGVGPGLSLSDAAEAVKMAGRVAEMVSTLLKSP